MPTFYNGRRTSKLLSLRVKSIRDPFRDQKALLKDTSVRTVLDVGAHKGDLTAIYLKTFPRATIYSFEPSPESFERLQIRFKGNLSVKPVQLAISSEGGQSTFFVNRNSATNSLLPKTVDADKWADTSGDMTNLNRITVETTTIDKFCQENQLDAIQILKLDLQGAELKALQGARRSLRRKAISLVFLETNFVPIYEGQCTFTEIVEYLSEYDYRLFNLYNLATAENGQLKWCDVLFRPEDSS